jgi:hypothetical protein
MQVLGLKEHFGDACCGAGRGAGRGATGAAAAATAFPIRGKKTFL